MSMEKIILFIRFDTHINWIAEHLPLIKSLKALEYEVKETLRITPFSSYYCSIVLKQMTIEASFTEVLNELFKCKQQLLKVGVNIDKDIDLEFYLEHKRYAKWTISWSNLAMLKTFGMSTMSFSINSVILPDSPVKSLFPSAYYYKVVYHFGGISSAHRKQIIAIWNKKFITKYNEICQWREIDKENIELWVKKDLVEYEWDEISNDIFYMFCFLEERELHVLGIAELTEYWYNVNSGELESTFLEKAYSQKIDINLEINGKSRLVQGFPLG